MLSNYEISANFQPITLSSITGVEDLGSNWYGSDWLGYFHFTSNDWCYHLPTRLAVHRSTRERQSLGLISETRLSFGCPPKPSSNSLAWSRMTPIGFSSHLSTADYKVYHYGNETWSTF